MTRDINSWYGVTVRHGEKIRPGLWRASAYIFRRDTQQQLGDDFIGEGSRMTSSDNAAFNGANKVLLSLNKPTDWKGPENGFR
jgi:hypothetical protein